MAGSGSSGDSDDPLSTRVGERPMLEGFLDWYRAVAAKKVRGLSDEDASRVLTPSGLSMLGIVQHLSWAEPLWFRWRFAGEDMDNLESGGGDNSPTFVLAPGETTAAVLDRYDDAIEHSRRVTGTAESLDQLAARPSQKWGKPTLRWIMLHMIEETARHAGHLDIMREQLDGATGD